MADLAAMPDQVDVQRIDPLRRRHSGEDLVGLVGAHRRADQAQAFTDAVDVRVDWHYRPVHVKHQYAGSGFGANARQAAQVAPGFLRAALRQFGIEILGERTDKSGSLLLFGECMQDILNARRFDVRQAADTYSIRYLVGWRVAHLFPGWECCDELLVSALRVDIGGVLCKDGAAEPAE